MASEARSAFIISPIGSPESETRKNANDVRDLLIKPIVEGEFGFECLRADDSYDNPKIDADIISHLIKDDLVIADLTGHNANVFYELAVRHSAQKPVILLIQADQKIPFDITTYRTIYYDFANVKTFKDAEEELRKQVQAVVDGKFIPDSPIKGSLIALDRPRDSTDNWNEIYAILRNHTEILSDLSSQIQSLVKADRTTSIPLRIHRAVPFYPTWEKAIQYFDKEGYQFVKRSKEEVKEVSDYVDTKLVSFFTFAERARENYENSIPWINLDEKNKTLWLWIKEHETVYTWSSVDAAPISERLAKKVGPKNVE